MHKDQAELKYFEGVGRRKTSVARARIYPDSENTKVVINDLPYGEYFKIDRQRNAAIRPLIQTNLQGKIAAIVKVKGGGLNAQAGAVSLALARALAKYNESWRPVLRSAGLLTRDPRMVERKKYGLKKARRAPQWAKR